MVKQHSVEGTEFPQIVLEVQQFTQEWVPKSVRIWPRFEGHTVAGLIEYLIWGIISMRQYWRGRSPVSHQRVLPRICGWLWSQLGPKFSPQTTQLVWESHEDLPTHSHLHVKHALSVSGLEQQLLLHTKWGWDCTKMILESKVNHYIIK